MTLGFFLICFPIIMSLIIFCIRVNKIRNFIAYLSTIIIMAAVGVFTFFWVKNGSQIMQLSIGEITEAVDKLILIAELILMVVVTILCFKYKKYWISLLSIVPTLLIAYFELFLKNEADIDIRLYIDHLSILMCLIVGVIGCLIVIYAVGYMHGYHHHHIDIEDRRYYFFMILFMFLGCMFGFVLSENLLWIDFFWEMTSVCSFLLIGYTKTEEAINNSFRALWMNLLGGCALAVAIVYFGIKAQTVSFHSLIIMGQRISDHSDMWVLMPIALIAFAAFTKAAQFPFSTWLIGAMVAPTPSSALLHSATMVKAGIYILFRLSPAMAGTRVGLMVSFIGGFTFFAASVIAIAQSDGKKVLAFSTISNLGLMVACAGVGRAETIWAGVFLMIFHAISKSLLFQDVGATENSIHSRDVEDMHGLLYRLPRLAIIMFIGIAGMFLAPFGMLISKWSALKASVDESNILLVFFICFGSATTSFYWTKWMGKIISHEHTDEEKVRDITKKNELISLIVHAILMITLCAFFPLLSKLYVDSLLMEMFGTYEDVLPISILYILVAIIIFVFAIPFFAYIASKKMKTNIKLSYMNGINVGNNNEFVNSFGDPKQVWMSNYYFHKKIGQRKLMMPIQVFTTAWIVVLLSMIISSAI